jgi:hypothetical protein
MEFITSNFPGGLFASVRHLVLFDIYDPFEHGFFVQIAATFPLLTSLSVASHRPQENTRIQGSDETESPDPIVQFDHLNNLELTDGHIDHAKQFLIDTNTLLPRLTELTIDYERLFTVTENCSSPVTRHNCINIKRLTLMQPLAYSKDMVLYFPRCR